MAKVKDEAVAADTVMDTGVQSSAAVEVTADHVPVGASQGDKVDLGTLSATQLREYVKRLQNEIAQTRAAARLADPFKEWQADDDITVRIPLGPTGAPITVNGKVMVGQVTIKYHEYASLHETLTRAWDVEQQRMQMRGNANPIELVSGDPSSTLNNVAGTFITTQINAGLA
jgi:hypothetical protein